MKSQDFKTHNVYLTGILGVLILSFYPALSMTYVFHDDVLFWTSPPQSEIFHPLHDFNIFLGRYLGAYLLTFYKMLVHDVHDLNTIRIVSVVSIGLCAFECYRLLSRYFKNRIDACLISIMIFTLPAFQMMAAWTGICFLPFAIGFALLAIYAADKIPIEGPLSRRIVNRYTLHAVVMLVSAHMVYQSAAAFYWAMAALLIVFDDKLKDLSIYKKRLTNIYAVGLIGILIYALVFKLFSGILNYEFATPYQPQKITHDIIDKLFWFFETVFLQTLNLWNIHPEWGFAVPIILFLLGATILKIVREGNQQSWLRVFINMGVVVSLIFLSYLPNLLAVINLNVYRCAAGLTTLWIIFIIWALKIYVEYIPQTARRYVFTSILCLVCFYAVYKSYFNIYRFRALPSHLEYTLIKNSIKEFEGRMAGIHIIQPKFEDFYHYHDEFGALTSGWNSDILPLLNCALNEIAVEEGMEWAQWNSIPPNNIFFYAFKDVSFPKNPPHILPLSITVSYEKPQGMPKSILIVDIRSLYEPIKQGMGKYFDFKVLNKRSEW